MRTQNKLFFIIYFVIYQIFAFAPAMAQNDQTIQKIENYFHSFQTLKGRFAQKGADHNIVQGTFYLQRPGKMRFDYDAPVPVSIIADGTWLIHYDSELEQASRALQSSTPADFFTRKKVKFGKDFFVEDLKETDQQISVLVSNPQEEDYKVRLFFLKNPLTLKSWEVIRQGQVSTKVTLLTFKTDIQIDNGLFSFISPEWEKEKRRQ